VVLVPFKTTIAVFPLDELLLIESWPVAELADVGLNCTCSVVD
jgi:hypothetical protein